MKSIVAVFLFFTFCAGSTVITRWGNVFGEPSAVRTLNAPAVPDVVQNRTLTQVNFRHRLNQSIEMNFYK